jgi:MFS transporter, DHA2 family, methylenomycin A resistance protein
MPDRSENVVDVSALDVNRPIFTAFITCLGCVVVLLDVSIVNVALQRISDGLGGKVSDLQWIVDAYTLAFASFLLSAGTAGDRYGNKEVFAAGFVLFTLASVFCGTATTMAILIAARVLQGLGAALIIPCSLTLLNHAFADPAQRAKAFGWWAGSGGVSVAAGPLIGGILVHTFGWRSIFFVNLPIGLAALLLTIRYIREEKPLRGRKIDFAGQVLSLLALSALTTVLIEGANWGWLSPGILGLAACFCLSSLLFLAIETRQSDPMLPLTLFHSVQFSVATILGLLLSFSFYGLIFTLSLYFQHVRHYTPLKTGLAFLPVTGLLTVMNISAGRLAAKRGMRFPIVVGFIVAGIGFFWLAFATNQSAGYIRILLPLLGIGAGVPLILPPVTSVLLASVARSQVGLASATLNAGRQIGAAAGVAVLGSLLSANQNFVAGFRVAMIVSGAVFMLGCLLAMRFIPTRTDQDLERQRSGKPHTSRVNRNREPK